MELPEKSVFTDIYFDIESARKSLFVWADKLVAMGGPNSVDFGNKLLTMLHAKCNIELHFTTNGESYIIFTSSKCSIPCSYVSCGNICSYKSYEWDRHIYFLKLFLDNLEYFDQPGPSNGIT